MQNIVYTTIPAVTVTITTFNCLSLFVPTFVPDKATPVMFNVFIKALKLNHFDSRTTDKKVAYTGLENQVDIGSAKNVNSAKNFIAAHQTEARAGSANKAHNVAKLDILDLRKYFVEIDGV